MGSLDGLNYGAFAPRPILPQPTAADYFGQGQQLAENLINQQFQAQVRARLLDEKDHNDYIQGLLGPIQVQQAQTNLDQSNADLAAFKLNNSPLSYLGPGGIGATNTPVSNPATPPSVGTGTGTTVRQTIYSPGETNSDPDTDAGRTSTGGPLVFARPGLAGTAAVDPSIIPYGSIIQRADGSTYVAADTGGAVKARTASQGGAPVVDFASKDSSIPDYGPVKITPPTADYLHLSPGQKLAYHAMAAGLAKNGQDAAVPDVVPSGDSLADSASQAQSVPAQDPLPTGTGPVFPNILTSPLVPIGSPNAQGRYIAPTPVGSNIADGGSSLPTTGVRSTPMQTAPGYIDPSTGSAVFSNDRRVAASLGAPYGMVSKPIVSAAQQTADRQLLMQAEKAGIDGSNYDYDTDGNLTPAARNLLRSDFAKARQTNGGGKNDSNVAVQRQLAAAGGDPAPFMHDDGSFDRAGALSALAKLKGKPTTAVADLSDLTPEQQLQASALSAELFGKKTGTQADKVNMVGALIRQGMDPSDIRGSLAPVSPTLRLSAQYKNDPAVTTYGTVATNYNGMKTIASLPSDQRSGADDLSFLFQYTNADNPRAAVTQASFNEAAHTGSLPTKIQNLYNGVVSGNRLTQDQVQQFTRAIEHKLGGVRSGYDVARQRYKDLADATGADGDAIVGPDFNPAGFGGADAQGNGAATITPAVPAEGTAGTQSHPNDDPVGTIRNQAGKRYQKQADGSWQAL